MTTQWNASLYDQKHDFVSKFGANLVDVLAPQTLEHILDVGCGTGDLANEIASFGAIVRGMDASKEMIGSAQQKYPTLAFETQDAATMDYTNQFDAVFSNAALHWMKQQEKVLANIYRALKPHGRFVAEMGGQGNIASIVGALRQSMVELQLPYKEQYFPWFFPAAEDYQAMLENAGFTVQMMTLYERPTPLQGVDGLCNWLVMFSNNILQHVSDVDKELVYAKCEELLKPTNYQNKQWIADYWRLRFVATK